MMGLQSIMYLGLEPQTTAVYSGLSCKKTVHWCVNVSEGPPGNKVTDPLQTLELCSPHLVGGGACTCPMHRGSKYVNLLIFLKV